MLNFDGRAKKSGNEEYSASTTSAHLFVLGPTSLISWLTSLFPVLFVVLPVLILLINKSAVSKMSVEITRLVQIRKAVNAAKKEVQKKGEYKKRIAEWDTPYFFRALRIDFEEDVESIQIEDLVALLGGSTWCALFNN